MKRTITISLTIIFIICSIFAIIWEMNNYSIESSCFVGSSFVFYLLFLIGWIAPKKFFNICWKITDFTMDDKFDYDGGYKYFKKTRIGFLITAYILLAIGVLIGF